MAHIRFLYGKKWKEFLGTVFVVVVAPVSPHIWLLIGVHMLFKEKQVHFETLAMRDQHSCSGSLKYDEQSLVDFEIL